MGELVNKAAETDELYEKLRLVSGELKSIDAGAASFGPATRGSTTSASSGSGGAGGRGGFANAASARAEREQRESFILLQEIRSLFRQQLRAGTSQNTVLRSSR